MDASVRILVLCANRLLRESISRLVSKKTEFSVIGLQAPDAVPTVEDVYSAADVLVCDSLPFVLQQRRPCQTEPANPQIKTVLVAMEGNPENFLLAVRHGVLAYVLQEASASEVVSAIRAVSRGDAVCPSAFTKLLFDCVAAQQTSSMCLREAEWRLTRREQQLIPLISRGLTNKEIANQLNVSEQTIKSHVHRILRKVGASGRQSLSRGWHERPVSPLTAD